MLSCTHKTPPPAPPTQHQGLMLILPIVVGTVGLLALTYKLYQWSKPKQADPAVLELLRAQGTLVITFVSLALAIAN